MAEPGARQSRRRRAPTRELFEVAEAAEYLHVSERTIRRLIHSGELRAYRLRGRDVIRIAKVDLDAMLRELKPGEVSP